ncbi:hypothetical protein BU16DRAFT_333771 [Lophium mytilinum]|uniref:Uncharacterized protein n=1 Tax=Lophium mytilinum TaxID=390894 RepID=A0A6A6R0S1_9PEZI|nr:hypothetical protein BU16DRAFT_333771 [Lophium mytilinum]
MGCGSSTHSSRSLTPIQNPSLKDLKDFLGPENGRAARSVVPQNPPTSQNRKPGQPQPTRVAPGFAPKWSSIGGGKSRPPSPAHSSSQCPGSNSEVQAMPGFGYHLGARALPCVNARRDAMSYGSYAHGTVENFQEECHECQVREPPLGSSKHQSLWRSSVVEVKFWSFGLAALS